MISADERAEWRRLAGTPTSSFDRRSAFIAASREALPSLLDALEEAEQNALSERELREHCEEDSHQECADSQDLERVTERVALLETQIENLLDFIDDRVGLHKPECEQFKGFGRRG